MNTADRIYLLVKRLPEAQARNVLDFVESIYSRFRQFSMQSGLQGQQTFADTDESLNRSDTQVVSTGAQSLAILQRNGFIGSLKAEPELSSRYKEELDWSDKV